MPVLGRLSDDDAIAALRASLPDDLEGVVEVDESGVVGLPRGGASAVVLRTPLDRLADPVSSLRALRRAVGPGGLVACVTTNYASQDTLVQVLRSDPRPDEHGEASSRARRTQGYATALKILLEAGILGEVVGVAGGQRDDALLAAALPLLEHLGVDPERATRHLCADFVILHGSPVVDVDLDEEAVNVLPISFAACVNDDRQLGNNLLESPPLAAGTHHELMTFRDMSSAAQGLNAGINRARHDLVVLIQQDIFIPSWWPARLRRQWAMVGDDIAVAGPVGVRYRQGGRTHVGSAIDRESVFRGEVDLPARVDGLDELVMIVPRDVSLRLDPALGWHLYGTDLALQANAAGIGTYVLDVPCLHNSLLSELDDAYHHAQAIVAAKWPRELPILTNVSQIDDDPRDVRIKQMAEEMERLAGELQKTKRQLARASERREPSAAATGSDAGGRLRRAFRGQRPRR